MQNNIRKRIAIVAGCYRKIAPIAILFLTQFTMSGNRKIVQTGHFPFTIKLVNCYRKSVPTAFLFRIYAPQTLSAGI